MADNPNGNAPAFTRLWLVGVTFILIGLLTLLLTLGWFRQIETVAVVGGLGIVAAVFLAYSRLYPDQGWAGWLSYALFGTALFLGVAFLVDFDLVVVLAWGVFLAAVTALVVYVRRNMLAGERYLWWTALVAGGLLTIALTIIQLRVGWPPWLLPGIMTTTFMAGATLTLALVWLPQRHEPDFGWLISLMVITGLLTIFGFLLTIDMLFLALPLLLLGLGGYYLLRGYIMQERAERARGAAARPPARRRALPSAQVQLPPARRSPPAKAPRAGDAAVSMTPPGAIPAPPTPPNSLPEVAAPPPDLPEELTSSPVAIPGATIIHLSSSAMREGRPIPGQHTCDGANLSPPLEWPGVPAGTESLALLCDCPDIPGGAVTHWLAYNLPAGIRSLPPGMPQGPQLPAGGAQGKNSFGRLGYDGPCPPAGRDYHYQFRLYALKTRLTLPPGATRQQLLEALHPEIILAVGALTVIYRRGPGS